jgi:hypothetical protein
LTKNSLETKTTLGDKQNCILFLNDIFYNFYPEFYVQQLISKTLNGQHEKKSETLFSKRKTSVPLSSPASFWVAIILGGNCPGWQLSGWQLSWVAIVQVVIVLGGNYPDWHLSWVAIVPGDNCPG